MFARIDFDLSSQPLDPLSPPICLLRTRVIRSLTRRHLYPRTSIWVALHLSVAECTVISSRASFPQPPGFVVDDQMCLYPPLLPLVSGLSTLLLPLSSSFLGLSTCPCLLSAALSICLWLHLPVYLSICPFPPLSGPSISLIYLSVSFSFSLSVSFSCSSADVDKRTGESVRTRGLG